MEEDDEMTSTLLLAYPGTGARTLCTDKHVHLDLFGYRAELLDYSGWTICIDVLRSRIADAKFLERDVDFVGWGSNWKDIMECFHAVDITVVNIPIPQYFRQVRQYRLTKEYSDVDLKFLNKDLPIHDYCDKYFQFLIDAGRHLLQMMANRKLNDRLDSAFLLDLNKNEEKHFIQELNDVLLDSKRIKKSGGE